MSQKTLSIFFPLPAGTLEDPGKWTYVLLTSATWFNHGALYWGEGKVTACVLKRLLDSGPDFRLSKGEGNIIFFKLIGHCHLLEERLFSGLKFRPQHCSEEVGRNRERQRYRQTRHAYMHTCIHYVCVEEFFWNIPGLPVNNYNRQQY